MHSNLKLFAIISLVAFCLFPNIAKAATPITRCTQINSSGEYVLGNDIINTRATYCIDIRASDVIFDCQGHTIDGTDSYPDMGIYIYNAHNVTIKGNCIITDWDIGIRIYGGYSNTLEYIVASSSRVNIDITNSYYNYLTEIISDSGVSGLNIRASHYNIIYRVTFTNNTNDDLVIDSSQNNTVSDSIFKTRLWLVSTPGVGIAKYNLIYNNIINGSISFADNNYLNTTLSNIRTNIVGGPYIGGNYWDGWSESCNDTDKNGICDEPYRIPGTLYYDYLPLTIPPPKNVSLTVSPLNGTTTTIFYFNVSTKSLVKPYNISMYYDGNWLQTIYNIYEDTKTIDIAGFPVGTHRMYVVVRDSEGWQAQSNEVQFTITGAGISPFELYVSPSSGNATDIFTFTTSQIYGGTPPYTVTVYLNTTDIEAGHCYNIPENGICKFSTLLPCGNWIATAVARDSAGGIGTSTAVEVNVICKPMGAPLTANLSMSPSTGDSKTIFTFTLNISGGAPPYYVSWLRWGNVICGNEMYSQNPPLTIRERFLFPAGSNSMQVSVKSSDGQVTTSNRIDFEVAWAGYANITAYDCIGTLGETVERPTAPPVVGAPPIEWNAPLVNSTEMTEAGVGWLLPFLTPFFFALLIMFGVAGSFSFIVAKAGGGGSVGAVIFVTIVLIMSVMYVKYGIFEMWIGVIIVLAEALLLAYLLSNIFGGKV